MSANQQEVFQSWLEKKQTERKKILEEEKKRITAEEQMTTERLQRGKESYRQWIIKIQQLDELKRKEMIKRRQYQKLIQENIAKHKRESELEYQHWKQKKDREMVFEKDYELGMATLSNGRIATPPLPGYVSVWSCDEEIAELMLSNVKRPLSCTLTQSVCN